MFAFSIFQQVAHFFQKFGDYASAIQFLVMSKCTDEAFHLARLHGQMELYAEALGREAAPEEYESVALHFEGEGNFYLAGKYYMLASAYAEALKHLVKKHASAEVEAQAIELAVECVGKANNEGSLLLAGLGAPGDKELMEKARDKGTNEVGSRLVDTVRDEVMDKERDKVVDKGN